MSWKNHILNPVDEPPSPPPQTVDYPESQRYGQTAQFSSENVVPRTYTTTAGGSGGNAYPEEDAVMVDAPMSYSSSSRERTGRQHGTEPGYQDDASMLSVSQNQSSRGGSTPGVGTRVVDVDVDVGADETNGNTAPGEVICYGTVKTTRRGESCMIARLDVKLMGNMSDIDKKLAAPIGPNNLTPAVQQFSLSHQLGPGHVQLSFPSGLKFGQLRQKDSRNIDAIMSNPAHQAEFEAVAPTRTLRETIGKAKTNIDAMVQVSINVYGPRDQADNVGEKLSDAKMFLQPPDSARPVPYENPHILKFPDLNAASDVPIKVNSSAFSKRGTNNEVEDMQDFLNESVFPELRRNAELDSQAFQGALAIKTSLLLHQRKALNFMSQRETGNIDPAFLLWQETTTDEGRTVYRHRITSEESVARPDERGGGILADEMGMGKSLSVIALIMERATEGIKWANFENSRGDGHGQIRRYTKATLIIASSALIINTWESEIHQHLKRPEEVKVVRYHGPRSNIKLANLEEADIVVTTYNTLATEFAGGIHKSLLHSLKWCRIVLDEAHYIRRQATTFHKACHELEAESRWCLTGTPIQNRLDDIGALFAFIRIRPFHGMNAFRGYVTNPYVSGGQYRKRATDNLVALMDSLCLRRTRDEALDLPEPTQIMRPLDFTPQERAQYENTEEILSRIMKQRVGEYSRYHWEGRGAMSSAAHQTSSSQFGLFQVNLQLRILCNHGTFQQPFSWQRRSKRDLYEAEVADPATAGTGEQFCSGCGTLLPVGTDCRVSAKCAHLLCTDCLTNSSNSVSAVDGGTQTCPLCSVYGRLEPLGNGDEGEEDDDHYFRREGLSTKMTELVKDVKDGLEGSKSIIFSCWTRTLSLIARHLDAERIPYERIDGTCSLSDRQTKLNNFAGENGKPILIMTTGTGAFGLNLTTANRVFIVELQWNPSVENQAISRAIRLGQTEMVTVTRYYVKDTVEQQMMDQQEGKRRLASIGNALSKEVEMHYVDGSMSVSQGLIGCDKTSLNPAVSQTQQQAGAPGAGQHQFTSSRVSLLSLLPNNTLHFWIVDLTESGLRVNPIPSASLYPIGALGDLQPQ
ncbi:SNF2 family N-terminal domain-containing protein [Zalerion maritima]|uniref:SNF2 family N-terminal domain-containing protein n=1 Tax=Zalerion maritima TaxID=339359 RepID=A0AAD5S4K9_9PEZI|nr:SNF2 family N-terminal domain-containing protein [Zalerion maritima]